MTEDHTGWTGYHVNPAGQPDLTTAPAARIVVALDGPAHAERSLEVADAHAAAAGLPLHLVRVCGDRADFAETDAYVARVARRTPRVSGMAVEIGVDPAGHLSGLVESGALLVLATHARGPIGEVLFGSVADAVLHHVRRPVLLVGPAAGVPDPAFTTMVVPDDAGVGAWRLRERAAAWALHLGAAPCAVQVVPSELLGRSTDVLETADLRRAAEELGPNATWEVLDGGGPAERIVEFAREQNAGLIAMTVTPRHRLGPDIAGGVALHVIRRSPCPVLALGRTER